MKTTTAWNKIFKDEGRVFHDPHEFMPKIVREFKKAKVKRILDLGCGTGRHLVYLAKKGFTMKIIFLMLLYQRRQCIIAW